MTDLATVTMIGRLTRNPEQKDAGNSKVAKFSLAVNGYKKDDVSFFDCEAWGKLSDVVQQYCTKGKQVGVSGTIRIDRYEDKDGNARQRAVISVRDLTLLGSKEGGQSEAPKQEAPRQEIPDDLPF
tara:strand:- start:583 stop:960 length:378 start_codon:yes stop_codon:yes gene_type:complete